jgi:hypothetical protein
MAGIMAQKGSIQHETRSLEIIQISIDWSKMTRNTARNGVNKRAEQGNYSDEHRLVENG